MNYKPGPTQARLLELFYYSDGSLLRRVPAKGKPRNSSCAQRTRRMRVDLIFYEEHRLVWLYHTERWPDEQIDHINGNPLDNRIENLRDVTRSVNMQNQRRATCKSKTGLLGVYPHRKKFAAGITVDGKIQHLGVFANAHEGHAVYLAAKRALHEGCTI